LNGCDKAFKAHAGVNVFGGKRLQGTVILAIELDEDIVPDLHNERVVFIDKVGGITTTYMIIMNLTEISKVRTDKRNSGLKPVP
jgi:hypothetical protein